MASLPRIILAAGIILLLSLIAIAGDLKWTRLWHQSAPQVFRKRTKAAKDRANDALQQCQWSFAIAATTILPYAYSEVRLLSLPISQILALFTILLPIATGISALPIHGLLRMIHATNLGRTRPTLYLILLLAFQLMYETVIATIALTYMGPPSSLHCGLEEQWKRLYMNKDGAAVKRIQDRFDCCGFNTVLDRAWPFPPQRLGAGECQSRFDRTQSCAGPWRQAEQVNAGLFLTVAVIIFVAKLIGLTAFFTTSTTTTNFPWLRSSPFPRITASGIEDGRRLIEEGEPQQGYRDEVIAESEINREFPVENSNINGNGPRIEPSGLLGTGEGWSDDH